MTTVAVATNILLQRLDLHVFYLTHPRRSYSEMRFIRKGMYQPQQPSRETGGTQREPRRSEMSKVRTPEANTSAVQTTIPILLLAEFNTRLKASKHASRIHPIHGSHNPLDTERVGASQTSPLVNPLLCKIQCQSAN